MDQNAAMREASATSQDPRSRWPYVLLGLTICWWRGFIIDDQFVYIALMVLCVLPHLTLNFSKHKLITTVLEIIYISKEVTIRIGGPENLHQHPVLAQKQGPNESIAMVLHQRSAQQEQPSNPGKVPLVTQRSERGLAVIPSFRDAVSRQPTCPNAAALKHLPMVDLNISSLPVLALPVEQISEAVRKKTEAAQKEGEATVAEKEVEVADREVFVQVEPDCIKGPSEREVFLEKENALQINHETTEEPTSSQTSTGAEDKNSRHTVPQTNNIYIADRTSVEKHQEVEPRTFVNSTDGQPSATASFRRIAEIAQKSKAPCRPRPQGFMHRFQLLEGCHADRVRVRDLKMIREKRNQNRTYQQAVADCVVEAQGGMIGLEIEERAERQARAGSSTVAAISQPARAESAVDAEGRMDGLEFYTPVDEEGDVAMTDAPPDESVDEVMIGSDVDGEMEVDSDEDTGVDDGEPMDVSEEGHNVEASKPSASDPMANAGYSDPMAVEPQKTASKVNLKALQDRIQREKEIALRNTSYSGGVAAWASSSASPHLNRQHAAPAATSETGNTAISIPPRVVQNIASTNSASELREARLGKRAESKFVQEGELSLAISRSSQPISASASIVFSSTATKSEDGNDSETTRSTNTPRSTLPSSNSSTAPSSPLPMPTVPKAATQAPNNVSKPTAPNASPQAPTNVSSTSLPTPATTVKRKLPIKDTNVGKAETHHTTNSPGPRPIEDSRAKSSKKARSKPQPSKTDAASADEVAPLSDIPDDRGQLEYMSQHLEVAAGKWEESGFADSSDDEDDEDKHGVSSSW